MKRFLTLFFERECNSHHARRRKATETFSFCKTFDVLITVTFLFAFHIYIVNCKMKSTLMIIIDRQLLQPLK